MRPDRYDVHRAETTVRQEKARKARATGWMWMGQGNGLLWNGRGHAWPPLVEAEVAPPLPWSYGDAHELRM